MFEIGSKWGGREKTWGIPQNEDSPYIASALQTLQENLARIPTQAPKGNQLKLWAESIMDIEQHFWLVFGNQISPTWLIYFGYIDTWMEMRSFDLVNLRQGKIARQKRQQPLAEGTGYIRGMKAELHFRTLRSQGRKWLAHESNPYHNSLWCYF